VAFALSRAGLDWQVKMAFILLPTLAYGALFLGQEFPPTERVQQGVSTAGMYRAVLRPLFVVIVFCMILPHRPSSPHQWIAYICRTPRDGGGRHPSSSSGSTA
jgi:hypothetical protein